MSEDRPKRRRRRRSAEPAEQEGAAEASGAETPEEARSADEGPVAPQAGVGEARSQEARSAEEGPVAPQAGVDDADEGPEGADEPSGGAEKDDSAAQDDDAAGDDDSAPDAEAATTAAPRRRRRRGSADTGAGRHRSRPRREVDGDVVVRAHAKYVRCAPRKARLVVEHIRGKPVDEARAILRHTPRHAARDVLKLLESCVANAENNHELVADELVVHQAYVDEGPTIRRYRPRAYGRATRINKRTSHMTLTLTPSTSKE
jgi:ribosomal protein L22